MTDDMHQLHRASDDDFVARIHQAMLAMRGSVCDSGQAQQANARTSSSVSDEPGQADAKSNIAGNKTACKPINTYASSS